MVKQIHDIMKNVISLMLILVIFLFYYSNIYSQLCSALRFGNAVYYKIDKLSTENLRGTSIAFDKKINNRFFDTFLKVDSIGVIIDDTCYYFHQKKIPEPKEFKEIIFYRSRDLINKNITIKKLKLLNINKLDITAQAIIQYKTNGKPLKNKKIIYLPLNEMEGVILGAGKNSRLAVYGGGIIGGLIAAILIF